MNGAAAATDLLSEASLTALATAGPVDVVAGVHVANQAGRVVEWLDALARSLAEGAPSRRAAVLVADAGSRDATPDLARGWCDSAAAPAERAWLDVIAPRHRARAILGLLAAAQHMGARAMVLLDADLAGVDDGRLSALLEPVLQGEADYVSPAYSRTIAEGTLTTNLLAPLTGALYGGRLQQVMGGCAGLAGAAIGSWLKDGTGAGEWQPHGAELWLTTTALATGARIAEVALGRKLVAPAEPPPDLASILVRTVGPLFALMEQYGAVWPERAPGATVARRGDPPEIQVDARAPAVEQMVHAFDLGLKDLLPVWEQIMPEETLVRLYPLGLLATDEFGLPARLWARIVSDFAVAYHERLLPRDHLLRALTPLYLGRVAAFILETRATPLGRIPQALEAIDRAFETEKHHLVARWR
ncbi:MAG TPA: glycosyltransferase [Candidatus Methylomirabilis sp.]|nr:glycosyltransferase [Candidatus Methylomirabilis sp.]